MRWTVWEMPMKGAGRGFGTGMHTWRRTEKNQTKPNFALSWPCSPQSSHRLSHFSDSDSSDSSHLYLSLGAHSPMGVVHPTSSEDKCPLLKLAFSEWHSSFQKSTSIFLIDLILLIYKSFNHMSFLVHMPSFLPPTLGKISHTPPPY